MDAAVESISSRPDFVAMRAGEWMNGFTPEIARTLSRCEDLCFRLNATPPSLRSARDIIVREIVAEIGGKYVLHSPFYCDFGFNIRIGENFVGNYNLTILDEADVTIGDNVFIGPNTTLCTIIHSIDAAERNAGIMQAKPVTIGNNVWIASNVVILPGVTVGEGAVVGAGSVVTKDVSPFTVVAGNPAKTIRNIRQAKNFS